LKSFEISITGLTEISSLLVGFGLFSAEHTGGTYCQATAARMEAGDQFVRHLRVILEDGAHLSFTRSLETLLEWMTRLHSKEEPIHPGGRGFPERLAAEVFCKPKKICEKKLTTLPTPFAE
jgi:hypothetical protein